MPSCGVCVSVCLSVTFVDHVKTNKCIFKFFSPSGSTIILVFPYQTGWRYSDGNPLNRGVECRLGRQKTQFWTNIWLRCIQVYSVVNRTSREVLKTKPRRRAASAEHLPRRPSSVFRTRGRRSVCDVLDVIRRRRREVKPPFVITPFSAAVGHRRTEPGRYFLFKTDTNPYSCPYPDPRGGILTPTDPRTAANKVGYDLGVFVRGGVWSDTAGDNRRQQNRI